MFNIAWTVGHTLPQYVEMGKHHMVVESLGAIKGFGDDLSARHSGTQLAAAHISLINTIQGDVGRC